MIIVGLLPTALMGGIDLRRLILVMLCAAKARCTLTFFVIWALAFPVATAAQIISLDCNRYDDKKGRVEVEMQFDFDKKRVRMIEPYYGTVFKSEWMAITHMDSDYIAWRQLHAFAVLDRRTLNYTATSESRQLHYQCTRPL